MYGDAKSRGFNPNVEKIITCRMKRSSGASFWLPH